MELTAFPSDTSGVCCHPPRWKPRCIQGESQLLHHIAMTIRAVSFTCLIPQKALGSKGDSYFGKGLCGRQADLYQSIFREEAIPQAQRPKIVVWGMKSSDPDGEEQSEECSAF